MRSRQDLMQDGITRATDGTFYPDVITFDIQKFRFTRNVIKHTMSTVDVQRPDLMINRIYGIAEFDDIVLWLNLISNINDEEAGKEIKIPAKLDVEKFYLNNLKG